MKKTAILAIFSVIFLGINAQTKNDSLKLWKSGGSTSLNFSQVSFSNWSGGGNNSMAGTFLFKGFLNYKKNKSIWDNSINIGYGLSKQEDQKLSKTEDKLQITSKYGYQASKFWFYSAMLDFKTQFAKGYKDPLKQENIVSTLMAPGYLSFSLGMDYKPNDNFSLFLSPLTSKTTFVMDDDLSDAGAFGVEKGENVRQELGAMMSAKVSKNNIVKNVNAYSRLDLFSNYGNNPQNVDVDFEVGLDMKINKFLSATFKVNMLYDDDTKYINDKNIQEGARLQTKQLFGAGLSYTF